MVITFIISHTQQLTNPTHFKLKNTVQDTGNSIVFDVF